MDDWFKTSATAIIPLLLVIRCLSAIGLYSPEVSIPPEVSKWAAPVPPPPPSSKSWTTLPARTDINGGACRALPGFVVGGKRFSSAQPQWLSSRYVKAITRVVTWGDYYG